jgi:glycosyltransferase involved in cell wall biosynthesis
MSPPGARLVIIGEGKERHRLAALAKQLGIAGRLDMAGFKANPFPYLARADLLVLSSRREGLPNALVEALALGISVVATDCSGGIRTLLRSGEVGCLVPVDDPRALANAMTRALAESASGATKPEIYRELAKPYRLIPATLAWLDFLQSLPMRD